MRLRSLVLSLILSLMLCATVTAQATQNSTPQTTSATALSEAQRQLDKEADNVKREADALRLELRMRRLLDEVRSGRELISSLREEVKSADAQLAVEKENSASLERIKTQAEKEIALLSETVELKSQANGILQKDRERLKAEVGKQRKRVFWLTVATAAATSILILK